MNQVKAYSKRLKLSREIVDQAEEYHRLAEVKCSSSLRAEPCLSLVCIDLACVKHGEPVDKVRLAICTILIYQFKSGSQCIYVTCRSARYYHATVR